MFFFVLTKMYETTKELFNSILYRCDWRKFNGKKSLTASKNVQITIVVLVTSNIQRDVNLDF